MEEKKKGSVGIIVFVIILMLACFAGGYFLNSSGLVTMKAENETKESNNKAIKCSTIDAYETIDKKVTEEIDRLIAGLDCFTIEEFTNDKKVTANDITNDRAFEIAQWDFYKNNKEDISLDEYTKEVKKHLGKDYNFDPTKVDYNSEKCPQYKYDEATKTFKKQQTACGGTCGPRTTFQITKALEKDGVLEISMRVVFFKGGVDGYFSDYAKTNQIVEGLDNYIPYEKGSLFKFTFENVDGNYAFVSSELVNK